MPLIDIIWTENSDVIDRFISETLKYKSSVIVSSTEKILGRTIHTHSNRLYYVQLEFNQRERISGK